MATRRYALAEQRRLAGLSQERLAKLLRVDRSTILRWEAGETTPQPWVRPKLAAALRVSGDELMELFDPDSVVTAVVDDRPPEAQEAEQLAKALENNARCFDGPLVTYLQLQLRTYMRADGAEGPRAALPGVLGLLRVVEDNAREVPHGVRGDLLQFGAKSAEFAGWLYRDLQDPAAARFWYDRATEWAQEAGDLPFQGYVLLKKSQMAYEERDGLRVLAFAQAAYSGPWQLPAAVRAEVVQQEARGLAMLGEPLDAVERKLDEAQQLAATPQTTAEHQRLSSYYNEQTHLLRVASCYIEAGKPVQAATLFAEVVATQTLSRRDEGYFRARRAVALALSGEPDTAALEGVAAVQLASELGSGRTKGELKRVVAALRPWQNRPAPRALDDALRT